MLGLDSFANDIAGHIGQNQGLIDGGQDRDDGLAATGVACDCWPSEADVVTEAKALLRYAVVWGFQLGRIFAGLVGPLLIARAMFDCCLNRKPGAQ